MREVPDGRGRVAAGDPYVKTFDRIPPDAIWKAVEVAWRQSGVKPTMSDAGNRVMSYIAAPAGKKIGNVKIENAFDCGGEKKAPLAARTELTVSVSTLVRALGDGSEVTTSVTATPTPAADGSPAPVCKSKGTLERKLEPQVKVFVVTTVRR